MAFKLTKVNSLPGENISVDTDDVPELINATNLWYTQARADTAIDARRLAQPTIQDKHFYTLEELSVKTGDLYWQIVSPIEIMSVQAVIKTSPVGSKITLDVVKNEGATIADTLFTLEIFPNDQTVQSNTSSKQLAAGDYVRIDILQIGSTTPGSDLTVSFKYKSIL